MAVLVNLAVQSSDYWQY